MEHLATNDRFTGAYRHSLDAKGRVTVPARWRQSGMDVLFAMDDVDLGILKLLPKDEMERTGQSLFEQKNLDPEKIRIFRRVLYGRATECAVDSQGRVLLPAALTEKVGLGREVTLVGVGERIEVWDPRKWDAAEAADREVFDKMARELGF